jgi:hypothetical protein
LELLSIGRNPLLIENSDLATVYKKGLEMKLCLAFNRHEEAIMKLNRNFFITLFVGLLVGWGLSYTNCGTIAPNSQNLDTSKNLNTTSMTKSSAENPIVDCMFGYEWNGTACVPTGDFPIGSQKCASEQYYVGSTCFNADDILTNPKNKMDYVGKEHNLGVEYVMARLPKDNKPTLDTIIYHVAEYQAFIGQPVDTNKIKESLGFKSLEDLKSLDISTGIPANIRKYYDQIQAISKDYKGAKDTFDRIVKVEDTILNDKKLSKSEMDMVLGATSISRFSNFYWSYYPNVPDPGKIFLTDGFTFVVVATNGGIWNALTAGIQSNIASVGSLF